jgi:hypothetical protein
MKFLCEQCGHILEVDESLVGKHGHCKNCGHEMTIPSPGFRLEPLQEAMSHGADAAKEPAPAKHSAAPARSQTERVKLAPIEIPTERASRLDEDLDDGTPYEIDKDFEPPPSAVPSSSVPVLMEARAGWRHLVRKLLGTLSKFEDAIYLVLMLFWMIGAVAFLFELKPLAWSMLGLLVICSVLLLLLGGLEVFIKPFRESLRHGLAFVLLPPYAIYYVATRWPQMKRPFKKAVGAFLPLIVLVVLALLGRPIRDWFLHPPPKKDDQQSSLSGLPSVPTPPRILHQAPIAVFCRVAESTCMS